MQGQAQIPFWLNTYVFFEVDDPSVGIATINAQTAELSVLLKGLTEEGWEVSLEEVEKGDFRFMARQEFPSQEAALASRAKANADGREMFWWPGGDYQKEESFPASPRL